MAPLSTVVRRFGVSAFLVAAGAFGTAGAAAAAPALPNVPATPSNCDVTQGRTWAVAVCGSGSGEYRATVRCNVDNWPDYNRYGKWTSDRQTSTAACDPGHWAFNGGYQTR